MSIQKPQRDANEPDWMAVLVTHNLPEAHIVAGKLRANELDCLVHQEPGASALGITLGNLGEIKVLVAPADFERAEAILFPPARDQIEADNQQIRLIWRDDDVDEQ